MANRCLEKMTDVQRAVWRNGGSHSAENDVRTRTAAARRTCSESRRCAKPPGRCVLSGDTCVAENDVRKRTKHTTLKINFV
jgi:hypothetical protein